MNIIVWVISPEAQNPLKCIHSNKAYTTIYVYIQYIVSLYFWI